jgi:hypothetical protein
MAVLYLLAGGGTSVSSSSNAPGAPADARADETATADERPEAALTARATDGATV